VLVNMAFNMGINGLLGFKHTLELVRTGNYADAADAMLNSKWAEQVGPRAKRLSEQMRTGEWQ
jgi:lysozyme